MSLLAAFGTLIVSENDTLHSCPSLWLRATLLSINAEADHLRYRIDRARLVFPNGMRLLTTKRRYAEAVFVILGTDLVVLTLIFRYDCEVKYTVLSHLATRNTSQISSRFVAQKLFRNHFSDFKLQFRNYKVVYRRYAGLFFCICVDANDNELAYLEAIHLFVEVLGTIIA